MPRPFKRSLPLALDSLDPAWRAYNNVRRSLWLLAPGIERALFRTHDLATYQLQRNWFTKRATRAYAAWVAACRRVHRGVQVVPVGIVKHGMPPCFLVRVPKHHSHSMMVTEHVWGKPVESDREAHEKLRQVRQQEAKERREALERKASVDLHVKMMAALTAARWHLARKHNALEDRARLSQVENAAAWETLSQRAYKEHSEHTRKMKMAVAYCRKLKAVGLYYDLADIATPLEVDAEA